MAHSLDSNKDGSYESTYKKLAGSGDHSHQIELMLPINAVPNLPSLTSDPGWTTRAALESLIPLTQLLVQKEVQTCNSRRAFQIKANLTQQLLFQGVETPNCLTNCRWGPNRSFEMEFLDNSVKEVIHLQHSLRSENCSALPQILVFSPPDTLIGVIQVERSCCQSLLTVKDSNRESVLTIEGPCCVSAWFSSVEFKILTTEGCLPVGKITKNCTRWFGRGDSYKISFPEDLDVKMKGVMVGACILIDVIRPVKFWTGLLILLISFSLVLTLAFLYLLLFGSHVWMLIVFAGFLLALIFYIIKCR